MKRLKNERINSEYYWLTIALKKKEVEEE